MRRPPVLKGLAAFFIAFALPGTASAQTFYKWVDKDGKVQFADKPPAGFKGEVTKIDIDPPPPPPIPRPAPAFNNGKPVDATEEEKEKSPDIAAKRRAQREQLAARLTAARAKLDAARKALEEGEGTTEDERQFVREEFPRNEKRPERTPPPRTNCISSVKTDGSTVWNCPRPIPNDAYFERQKQLEEAVNKAEEELADAERDYRRGVD